MVSRIKDAYSLYNEVSDWQEEHRNIKKVQSSDF